MALPAGAIFHSGEAFLQTTLADTKQAEIDAAVRAALVRGPSEVDLIEVPSSTVFELASEVQVVEIEVAP